MAKSTTQIPAKTDAKSAKPSDSSEPQDNFVEIRKEIERQIGPLVQGTTREQVLARVLTVVREEMYSGPLPHPKHLEAYEDICPGLADRIVQMAEKALNSQIHIAEEEQTCEAADRKLGMWFGFGALCLLVGGAIICAIFAQTAIAGALLGIGVLGTVTRFVFGRNHSEGGK